MKPSLERTFSLSLSLDEKKMFPRVRTKALLGFPLSAEKERKKKGLNPRVLNLGPTARGGPFDRRPPARPRSMRARENETNGNRKQDSSDESGGSNGGGNGDGGGDNGGGEGVRRTRGRRAAAAAAVAAPSALALALTAALALLAAQAAAVPAPQQTVAEYQGKGTKSFFRKCSKIYVLDL